MKNRLLQMTLIGAKGLVFFKRGLVFLFAGVLGKGLEHIGYFLAHWIFFPIFRLGDRIRRVYLKRFGSLQKTVLELAAHHITLVIVLGASFVIMLGTETGALSSNEYLSGKHNLFSVYLGPGEEDLGVVEEGGVESGAYTHQNSGAEVGIAVPTGLPGAEIGQEVPTDMIDYNDTGVVSRSLMPGAVPTGPRDTIIEYAIQPGDTLGGIAARFNISVQTLVWENNLTVRSTLQVGQKLRVLPVSGLSYKVKKGDTVSRIAKLLQTKPEDIAEFNKIDDVHLAAGSIIIVPGGKKTVTEALPSSQLAAPGAARGRYVGGTPPPSLRNVGQGMVWPTTVRYITQYFRLRHPGLDIAGPTGTAIYASNDGVVVASGWNRGGYGYMILIDHGNGLMTRYGHNSRLFVEIGERVSKGQTISLMGSTGRSTGPHLHFEVLAGGVRVNPFLYVR
ncbi:MAG: M23 family metallopeptidase [Candidatus Magasanikbacteria bacterium]|nr:M23 family metallopeptidase [Candidatus Magasanikbacteria bacterium]